MRAGPPPASRRPERGPLAPAVFLLLAEASGPVAPLGRRVSIQARTQAARCRAQIPAAAHLHVAVDPSGCQFGEPDVGDVIAQVLQLSALPPRALTLELTETPLAGPGLEVDAALHRFQPDIVEVDRCFVAAPGRSERDDPLTRTLLELGRESGRAITAGGVEDVEQVRTLSALGVRTGQGFLFSTVRGAVGLHWRLRPAGHGSADDAARPGLRW